MAARREKQSPGAQGEAVQSGPLRIHAVAQQTGVPEPTLRAWELRYGVPRPQRSPSGYRLYSAGDVEQVRRMQTLCGEGMAASEAARVVRGGPHAAGKRHEPVGPADTLALAQKGILDAVVAFDPQALEAALQRLAFLDGPLAVLDGVLAPVLRTVGEKWHAGQLSVAQEHLLSHRVGTMLRDYLRMLPVLRPAPRAVLASFADDDHELGLLATAVRLAAWGLECVYLGARTPPGALRDAVVALRPALVGLSLTVALDRARARALLDDYAAAINPVPWLVGGAGVAGVADLVRAGGGHVVPADPDALRELVRRLTAAPAKAPRSARPLRGKR